MSLCQKAAGNNNSNNNNICCISLATFTRSSQQYCIASKIYFVGEGFDDEFDYWGYIKIKVYYTYHYCFWHFSVKINIWWVVICFMVVKSIAMMKFYLNETMIFSNNIKQWWCVRWIRANSIEFYYLFLLIFGQY